MPHLPLGALCPDSPHAVVVSLPTLADVIGYETGCPRVKAAVRVGYPRFVLHTYLCLLTDLVQKQVVSRLCGDVRSCIIVCNRLMGDALLRFIRAKDGIALDGTEILAQLTNANQISMGASCVGQGAEHMKHRAPSQFEGRMERTSDDWAVVLYPRSDEADDQAKAFAQHTGCRLSSRHAYEILHCIRATKSVPVLVPDIPVCTEARVGQADSVTGQAGDVAESVVALVQTAFSFRNVATGHREPIPSKNILLTNSGMGAFTCVQSAVHSCWQAVQQAAAEELYAGSVKCWQCPKHPAGRHRDTWLQLGWLYLDTTCALLKLAEPCCKTCDDLCRADGVDEHAPSPSGVTHLGHGLVQVLRVDDKDALEAALVRWGTRLAGVITECPTNPLVTTPDLEGLRASVQRHTSACMACGSSGESLLFPSSACSHYVRVGAVVVADPTMAGIGNVDVTWEGNAIRQDREYGEPRPIDVAVVSLTKYAAGCGDIMAGATAVHPNSTFAALLCAALGLQFAASHDWVAAAARCTQPVPVQRPYSGDLRRLAAQVGAAPDLVSACNHNAVIIARWLEHHTLHDTDCGRGGVRAVHWAQCKTSAAEHARLSVGPDRPGSMLTIELSGTWPEAKDLTNTQTEEVFHQRANGILAAFYDALPMVKGPSFGTTFTIACPFLYLAHFDLVSSPEGRAKLREANLNPYLVRLHVGTEPVDEILAALTQGLQTLEGHASLCKDQNLTQCGGSFDAV